MTVVLIMRWGLHFLPLGLCGSIEGNGTPLQYSCLENPMDGGAWWAAVYGVAQSRTRLKRLSSSIASVEVVLSDTFQGWVLTGKRASAWLFGDVYARNPEKAMAPHSSTLAWEIPWMEEPGRLQSMGSRRVRHDWVTSLSLFTFMHWRRKWQPTPVFLPGESQDGGAGGLPSMGSHRVKQSWSDLAAAAAAYKKLFFVK